jgi:hypothetical protein
MDICTSKMQRGEKQKEEGNVSGVGPLPLPLLLLKEFSRVGIPPGTPCACDSDARAVRLRWRPAPSPPSLLALRGGESADCIGDPGVGLWPNRALSSGISRYLAREGISNDVRRRGGGIGASLAMRCCPSCIVCVCVCVRACVGMRARC